MTSMTSRRQAVAATESRRVATYRADRLVAACAALLGVAVLWFAVTMVHPVGPPVLLWITIPLYGPIVSIVFWRAAQAPAMPAANRLFWRRLAPAPALVAIGQTAQALDVLMRPGAPSSHTGPLMLAFDGAALVVVIHALVRLPTGRKDRSGVLRIMLDAATVVLATGVFIWHFGTRQAVGTAPIGSVALSLVLVVLALLGVFALVKVMLSDHSAIDAKGVRYLAIAIFIGALGPMVQPLATAIDSRLYVVQISVPAVFYFAARAGSRQQHATPGPPREGRIPRSFSLLPYTAVAAVDGLLLWVACVDLSDIVVVAAGAVWLTALVVIRQITSMRDNARLLAQLEHGATHDALTGLPNRVLFHRRLQRSLTTGAARPVAVVLLDLDGFKEVNDTLGHEVGDRLLVALAQRLTTCVRDGDTVARLGGDEFVMVLDDNDPAAADEVAGRIIAALRQPVTTDGRELTVGASIGIADGRTGDDPSKLLRLADIAMYAAKKISGTAHLHYHDQMAASVNDPAGLAAELRRAIDNDELFLLYQPIVALPDGRLLGAEAVVRWKHPIRGVLTPDTFTPATERTGIYVPLTRWVMRTAIRQLAAWPTTEPNTIPAMLSINVSTRDLREPGLAADLGAALTANGVAPSRITVEITVIGPLEGDQTLTTCEELRALGVRLSLNDFGTARSTMTPLRDHPMDEIKQGYHFSGPRPAESFAEFASASMASTAP
jgi:diguanylate cyclase (GGDEF)-like protein